MSLAGVLSSYVNLNLLIVLGFLGLIGFSFLLKVFRLELKSQLELKLHYGLLASILVLSLIHPLLPRPQVFEPIAKMWNAGSGAPLNPAHLSEGSSGVLTFKIAESSSSLSETQFTNWSIGFAALIVLIGIALTLRDLKSLVRIKAKSILIRRIGWVQIFVSENVAVPFSFWFPRESNVIIPLRFLEKTGDFKIALAHEFQHHRQRDTQWVYLLWGLKLICVANPFIHLWNRWISEIQEFACDETLVGRNKVQSQAYARCLLEVAQTTKDFLQEPYPRGAMGMVFKTEGPLLKRRIQKMFSQKTNQPGRLVTMITASLLVSLLAGVSYAARGLVQDKRITMKEAQVLAEKAQSSSGFAVVMNEDVLFQLNRYVGTEEGRQFMAKALQRMEEYKPIVEKHLKKYNVPMELMALPITESGYQNLPESQNSAFPEWKAAGLWQFIRSTARNYGLRVDNEKDERLDVALETDAAMRLLVANHMRFKDWHLSLMAYNLGEGALQKGIDRLGTKDAWTLIKNGIEGDKGYLAKVMAAVIIMKNPEIVE